MKLGLNTISFCSTYDNSKPKCFQSTEDVPVLPFFLSTKGLSVILNLPHLCRNTPFLQHKGRDTELCGKDGALDLCHRCCTPGDTIIVLSRLLHIYYRRRPKSKIQLIIQPYWWVINIYELWSHFSLPQKSDDRNIEICKWDQLYLYHIAYSVTLKHRVSQHIANTSQPACPCGPHKGYIWAPNMSPTWVSMVAPPVFAHMDFKWVLTGFQVVPNWVRPM